MTESSLIADILYFYGDSWEEEVIDCSNGNFEIPGFTVFGGEFIIIRVVERDVLDVK